MYEMGIEQGMADEECVKAGVYLFRGQLVIGGCMEMFARRDALRGAWTTRTSRVSGTWSHAAGGSLNGWYKCSRSRRPFVLVCP